MTYIKKIEIHGFKSFANKTVITFPKGISCVIGANGSGKSNVSEAINFVIGKASKKDLRAERLTDFIFNGGKSGKPAQMAKVKIIFDNESKDFSVKEKELSISRTVSKKGSLYTINGQRTTREEVLSVLSKARISPDGHNIILQGEIQNFVSMDPIKRRLLIEEISGIAVYEDKKVKSLSNLKKVEEKIKEASIVLTEKKKLLDELEEQKKKAEEFKESELELRKMKASLLFKEIEEHNKEKDKFEREIKDIRDKIDKFEKEIDDSEKEMDKNEKRLDDIAEETKKKGFEEATEIRIKITNLENQKSNLEKEVKNTSEQIKRAKETRDNTKKELETKKKELILKEKELDDTKQKIRKLDSELKTKSDKVEEMTSGKKFKDFEKSLRETVEKIYSTRGDITVLESKLNLLAEIDDLEREIKTKSKEINFLEVEIEKRLDTSSETAIKQSEIEKQIRELQMKVYNLKTKSKLSYDVLGAGVKEVLKLRDTKKVKGVIGTLFELGKSEKKYALALTVSAGGRIMSIVVRNPDTAKECIGFLKRGNIGKATFLPITEMNPRVNFDREVVNKEGVVGYAIDLLKFDKKYEDVFLTVLRNTLVVRDFETAKRVGIGRYRMVTLDGELFETSGAITGGSREIEKAIGFKESSPDEEISEIETKLDEYNKYYNNLLERKKENDELMLELREKKAGLYREKAIHEGRAEEIKQSTMGFNKKKYNDLKLELKSLEKEKENIEKELREKPDESKIESIKEEEKNLRLEIESLTKKESEIKSLIELSIQKEINSFEMSIKDSENQESKFGKINNETLEELKKTEKAIKEQKEIEKKFMSSLSHLDKERKEIDARNDKLDIKVDKLRDSLDKTRDTFNKKDVERAKIVSKIESIQELLKEFSEIKIKKVKESFVELKTKISLLDKKVEHLKQNVNLGAWEIYRETEEDYNDISSKVQKLIDEQTEIHNVINEIESRKRSAFIETFDEINKYFDIYFKKLSPKGEAKLIIQNEQEIFTAGIDILARPLGKKMVSMKSMSGGEASITALAFIFAIQQYSPAPFYILDEVDAALDKFNSQILSKLFGENSQYAQFIIVTHNEDVLSAADVLYGVYLLPNDISKVVSLVLPKTQEDLDKLKKEVIKEEDKK